MPDQPALACQGKGTVSRPHLRISEMLQAHQASASWYDGRRVPDVEEIRVAIADMAGIFRDRRFSGTLKHDDLGIEVARQRYGPVYLTEPVSELLMEE